MDAGHTDTPEKDNVDAIGNGRDSQNEPNRSPPVLRADLQIPQSVINRHDVNENRKYGLYRWGIWIQAATLVAVVTYTVVSCNQWSTLEHTLKVANIQAKAAVDQAKAATEAANAATQANRLAEMAFKETQRSNELAYRSWIVIRTIDDIKIEKPFHIYAMAENVGHIPAYNLVVTTTFGFLAETPKTIEHPKGPVGAPVSIGVLGPGPGPHPSHNLTLTDKQFMLADNMIAALRAGSQRFYAYGTITYDDALGSGRRTRYCYVWRPQKPDFALCGHANSNTVE